jgi:hypothetical protein
MRRRVLVVRVGPFAVLCVVLFEPELAVVHARVQHARGKTGTPIVVGARNLTDDEFWEFVPANGTDHADVATVDASRRLVVSWGGVSDWEVLKSNVILGGSRADALGFKQAILIRPRLSLGISLHSAISRAPIARFRAARYALTPSCDP